MKPTKTLTFRTTVEELNTNLESYQSDMIQELICEIRKDMSSTVNWRDAAKFAFVCLKNDTRFDDLVEKTGTPWIPTPTTHSGWVNLFTDNPYLFGVTDDVVTDDIQEVVLFLDGDRHDVSTLIHNI